MSGLALIFFYIFGALTLLGAVGVVLLRNPMRAALCLLVSFVGVAALFFLRHAEFLGAVQLLVYAGGILVPFLFGIMFVSQKELKRTRKWHRQWPVAFLLALFLAFILIHFLAATVLTPSVPLDAFQAGGGNTEAVGLHLYFNYLIPFEVASVFLLVAMVGAILLGRGEVKP